jgi:hypothetical protein
MNQSSHIGLPQGVLYTRLIHAFGCGEDRQSELLFHRPDDLTGRSIGDVLGIVVWGSVTSSFYIHTYLSLRSASESDHLAPHKVIYR